MAMRGGSPDEIRAIAGELLALLEREHRVVDGEIAQYPKPIPRCDAQFNFLYDQRSALSEPIAWLREALRGHDNEEIVRACTRVASRVPCTQAEHESAVRARLRDALASADAAR